MPREQRDDMRQSVVEELAVSCLGESSPGDRRAAALECRSDRSGRFLVARLGQDERGSTREVRDALLAELLVDPVDHEVAHPGRATLEGGVCSSGGCRARCPRYAAGHLAERLGELAQ